jgi:RNA polymerase subunit RPABC4/transcription elongation factor Spt4
MNIDPFTLNNLLLGLAGVAAAFLAALWLSLMVWTYRDMRSRSRDPLLRILAVLLVVVLFLPGIFVYLILRPPRTLEEEYQKTLEEEALLQSIEERPTCPGCGARIKENWMVCPSCYTRLKKTCHECGRLMELAWNLCPYCGRATPGMRRENLTVEDALNTAPVVDLEEVEAMIPAEDLAVAEIESPPEEPEPQEEG